MNTTPNEVVSSIEQKSGHAWNIAWLLHLAIPALLVIDIVTARIRRVRLASPGNTVLVMSLLWLIAGVVIFLAIRNRPALRQRTYALLLGIYSLYLAVFLMESGIRLAGITAAIPGVQHPGIRAVTRFPPEMGPGMGGLKNYTTNKLGLRGPMPPAERGTFRIIAIGGSTTNCDTLDDSEAWPQRLMQDLNEKSIGRAWVGNAGVDGWNTIHHIVLMQWLPGLIDFDMAVFLVGVNDLQATLAFEGGPTEPELEKDAGYAPLPAGARWRTREVFPYFRRIRLFPAFNDAVQNLKARFAPPRSLPFTDINVVRKLRAESPRLDLPSLAIGLKEYRWRLTQLAERCRDLQKRCLFLTQPSLWRDNLTPAEERLLWSGYVGRWEKPKGYVSPGDMARAMDAYNRVLLDICRQYQLECLDLASRIPKDTTAFFDDMHFNPSGARLVAQVLSQYLAQRPPFPFDVKTSPKAADSRFPRAESASLQ